MVCSIFVVCLLSWLYYYYIFDDDIVSTIFVAHYYIITIMDIPFFAFIVQLWNGIGSTIVLSWLITASQHAGYYENLGYRIYLSKLGKRSPRSIVLCSHYENYDRFSLCRRYWMYIIVIFISLATPLIFYFLFLCMQNII